MCEVCGGSQWVKMDTFSLYIKLRPFQYQQRKPQTVHENAARLDQRYAAGLHIDDGKNPEDPRLSTLAVEGKVWSSDTSAWARAASGATNMC